MSIPLLVTAACLIALVASVVIYWVNGKSALWAMGFAVILMVVLTSTLLLTLVLVMRRLSN